MKKIKIIIAENDEDEQLFMKDGFEESGYFEVMAMAENGVELLSLLKEQQSMPDLVLSDLNMPGKTGYDVLKELRADERFSNLPIVITSTSNIQSVIETCMLLGATKFIQKPETFVEYTSFATKLGQHYKKDGGLFQ